MKLPVTVLIPVLISLCFQGANAATVYKWTDADGVVHFSDVPPDQSEIEEYREIPIASYDDPDADPDKYSIINQVSRMEERRRLLAEHRLAEKQLQLEARRLAQQEAASYNYPSYSYSDYQPYYVYSIPRRPYFSPRGIYYRKNRGHSYFSGHKYRNHRYGRFGHGYKARGHHGGKSFRGGNHGHHGGKSFRGSNLGIRF